MRRRLALSLVFACAACGPAQPSQRPGAAAAEPYPAPLSGQAPAPAETPLEVTIPPPRPDPPAPPPDPPASLSQLAVSGGWPLFHGDAARTGHVDARPILRPRILWRTLIGVQGWLNAPVLSGGLVIVASSGSAHNLPDARDAVFALDLGLGKVVWSTHFQGDANGVAATADRVIATSDDGHTYALDLKDGKVLWKQKGQGKVYSSPLILGDQVVVGDAGGALRSYALADGAPRWRQPLKRAIRGGAAADSEQIYAVSEGAEAIAVGLDGKVRWRVTVRPGEEGGIHGYAAPVLTERAVIIPFARDSYYSTPALIALDKKTGKTVWVGSARQNSSVSWGNIRSTPVLVHDLLVYGEPYSGDVAAIDAGTGRARYRKTLGPCFFPQYAAAVAAGDVVYLPRFDGTLSALRADSGAVLWQMYLGEEKLAGGPAPAAIAGQQGCAWEVPSGAPLYASAAVASDGTLLIGSAEGFLYAIGDAHGGR